MQEGDKIQLWHFKVHTFVTFQVKLLNICCVQGRTIQKSVGLKQNNQYILSIYFIRIIAACWLSASEKCKGPEDKEKIIV